MLILLFVGLTGITVYSQNENNVHDREAIKKYFEESVNPFLIDQQAQYMDALNDDDREEVMEIIERRNKNSYPDKNYSQRSGRGGKKQGMKRDNSSPRFKADNSKQDRIIEQLQQITEKYPDQNKLYSKAIESKIMIWKNDLNEMHESLGIQPHGGKVGLPGYEMMFNRIATPEGLLIWQPVSQRQTNKGNGKKSDRFGYRNQKVNPELENEIIEYAQTEILPVVINQRENFNKYLSDDEKKIIEDTRAKIKVRKVMFDTWYASEDFEPGKRAKDENFDAMREEMRSSMQKVRGISLLHNDELDQAMGDIYKNENKWENDIENIARSFNDDPEMAGELFQKTMNKELSSVKFLLLDPSNPHMFAKNNLRVFIYPNPFSSQATIAIVGAIGDNVQVYLTDKNDNQIKSLYDGAIEQDRHEIMVTAEDMDKNVTTVKIVSGDTVVKRKIALVG